ncbi:MAG: hypothetical protein Q8918_07475 [Bacteroidota bacterium]|nr:hypothetical protein [Bacteroidota bacterium]MDP4212000.1 hypothetical protein [Bacteroidota bacterium]MDP4249936.1 hypothetical protein [Bacteroidota bacterium]
MDQPPVQQLFFQHIKNNLPPHLSLVDEIAELLNISNDSAYRRIRCEKAISFEEIQKLSSHYKISLDQFLHLQSDSLIFSGKLTAAQDNYFEQYLKNLLQNLVYLNQFEHKHLYFLTKDIPWISFFQVPELSAFKIFLWMKSILFYENLKGKKFSLKNEEYSEYIVLGNKIAQQYNKIPTTEIWNLEGINITIQQIEYYRECGLFESKEDILIIYEKLEALLNHIERQAESGKKFSIQEAPADHFPDFRMFYNELALGDNTVLADLGKIKITYLNHSVIDFISTRDERFNNQMYQSIKNLISKSTQISTVGEKNRSFFFSKLRAKIQRHKNS